MVVSALQQVTASLLLVIWLSLWREETWWVRWRDFPRLQLALLEFAVRLLDRRVSRRIFYSFHAGDYISRWFPDHLLNSAKFYLIDLSRLPAFGSDHFTNLSELELNSAHKPKACGIDADTADDVWASDQNVNAQQVSTPGSHC